MLAQLPETSVRAVAAEERASSSGEGRRGLAHSILEGGRHHVGNG